MLQATEDRESIQRRASIVAAVEWAIKRCSANVSDELEQLAWANSAGDVSASNTTPGERLRVTRLEAEQDSKLGGTEFTRFITVLVQLQF
jgi:hypothetical protein